MFFLSSLISSKSYAPVGMLKNITRVLQLVLENTSSPLSEWKTRGHFLYPYSPEPFMKILPTPAVGLAQKGWKDAALWALRGGTGGSKRVSGGQILPPGLAWTECCGHHCWLLTLSPLLRPCSLEHYQDHHWGQRFLLK